MYTLTRHAMLALLIMTLSSFPSTVSAQEKHPTTSTRAEFERFCQILHGRWVGEVTWAADWPGLGKRGEKSVAFLTYAPTDDGQGMLVKFYAGSGSATGLVAYDAAGQEIRSQFVVSGGYLGSETITFSENQATISTNGSLPDGGRNKATAVRTFSEDGLSFVDEASGEIDGVPTDNVRQTFRKVSGGFPLAQEASDLKEFGDKLAGRWLRDIVYVHDWDGATGGRGDKSTGYHEFTWINDGQALREISFDGNNRAEGIFAWDPTSKRTVVFGTDSTGAMFFGNLKKIADNQWQITAAQGGLPEGKKFGGEIIYTLSKDGKRMDASGVLTLDGTPLDELQDVFHRLSP